MKALIELLDRADDLVAAQRDTGKILSLIEFRQTADHAFANSDSRIFLAGC